MSTKVSSTSSTLVQHCTNVIKMFLLAEIRLSISVCSYIVTHIAHGACTHCLPQILGTFKDEQDFLKNQFEQ